MIEGSRPFPPVVRAAKPTADADRPSSLHFHLLSFESQEEMFCDEFILADLRLFENCQKVLKGCDHCFNLAADMGGMGFIQSNHSVIFYNNVMISFNVMEACRVEGITRVFYASSACIYPEGAQHLGYDFSALMDLLVRQAAQRSPKKSPA